MESSDIDYRCPGRWVSSCQRCRCYLYLDNNKCETNDDKFTLEPRFEIDRDFQTMFIEILSEVNINEYGEFNATIHSDINEEYKRTFDVHGYENDTFYIRPFNWNDNDCTCGLD